MCMQGPCARLGASCTQELGTHAAAHSQPCTRARAHPPVLELASDASDVRACCCCARVTAWNARCMSATASLGSSGSVEPPCCTHSLRGCGEGGGAGRGGQGRGLLGALACAVCVRACVPSSMHAPHPLRTPIPPEQHNHRRAPRQRALRGCWAYDGQRGCGQVQHAGAQGGLVGGAELRGVEDAAGGGRGQQSGVNGRDSTVVWGCCKAAGVLQLMLRPSVH